MGNHYIATEYAMGAGVGVSNKRLPSFDKALLEANVGNYNLVRLSSILPAKCERVDIKDIQNHIKEGSLLPTAYATITCAEVGKRLASAIGVGLPKDPEKVGVIMEYSSLDISGAEAEITVRKMIEEGFEARGWELESVETVSAEGKVLQAGTSVSTFACIAEW